MPNIETVEGVRARYRPEKITTLFVGESAPHGGDFFYRGDSGMLRYMRQAVEVQFGKTNDFLKTFKGYGWYLDDLVLTPVNHLTRAERRTKCLEAQDSLADRIVIYRPEAIVSLLIFIHPIVESAAAAAGNAAPRYVVPFPGMGQQRRFKAEMERIVPLLPRH